MTTDITSKSEKQNCKACGKDFLIIAPEQTFYKRKGLARPENCPSCRQKRRLSLRNERVLYKRICDKCKKEIISTYKADSPYQIYCQECFLQHFG